MSTWTRWSRLRRTIISRSKRRRFYALSYETLVTYVRMSATVVVAVVVRLFLDCIGLIYTGQNPEAAAFWFAHCQQDGECVLVAFSLFFASLCGTSLFAWSCQDWISDPKRNPYAKYFSFSILVEASSWVPISVGVGKTNALVEWCMNVSRDDLVQMLLSSAISALLTLICALLTHISMKYCRDVASGAQVKEAGIAGFGKCLVLNTIYCLCWAVGWSNWAMVMALMDALEPGRDVHSTALAVGVISFALVCTTWFYLRFGPEPVIPDSNLQKLCYSNGYSSSLWRSLVSYLVYSCVVFMVMSCADPSYGLLHVVAEQFKAQLDPATFNAKGLLVLCLICLIATLWATLVSAAITGLTKVDMESSMKLSRSAYEVRERLCSRSCSEAELLGYEQMMHNADLGDIMSPTKSLDSPSCRYTYFDVPYPTSDKFPPDESGQLSPVDETPEFGHPLGRVFITWKLCASVLFYDVMALLVCTLWGTFVIRCFLLVFGKIAGLHSVLYVLSSFTYAILVILSVTHACLRFFPSTNERKCFQPLDGVSREIESGNEEISEPFLEVKKEEELVSMREENIRLREQVEMTGITNGYARCLQVSLPEEALDSNSHSHDGNAEAQ